MTTDPSPSPIEPSPEAEPETTASDGDPDPWRWPTGVPGGDLLTVEVSDTQTHLEVDPRALKDLVRAALAAEGVRRASISVALVDDATIRVLNWRHLGHDWPTDVISFGLSDPHDDELSGELVVSAEMAATTAREAGISARDELALYVVHGLLHLCGHDDATAEARQRIRQRESEILAAAGLNNTFPAVGPAGDASAEPRCQTSTPADSRAGCESGEAAPWTV